MGVTKTGFVLFAGSSTVSFGHTPTRRVLATALRPPLLVSPTQLRFTMQAGYLETTTEPTQHNQVCRHTIYTQGFIQDFEFGGGGGQQDGSRMIVVCESTYIAVLMFLHFLLNFHTTIQKECLTQKLFYYLY